MRVAVVGAGPAGVYCAEALATAHAVEVDIYESLPVPTGLVRYGVAPDHFSIRSVRDKLVETLENPLVRFRGNVHVGSDVTTDELSQWYDAVIYSYGASKDRELGIAGEQVPQSIAATDFVKWYTGHPDAGDYSYLIATATSVAVIGLGNVAVDVARILLKPTNELRQTDMPEHVLEAFDASVVTDVHIVGRRGPQHATFTTKELKELGEIPNCSVVIDPKQMPADDQEASASNRVVEKNLSVMRNWISRTDTHESTRTLHFHFYSAPVEFDIENHCLKVERLALNSNSSVQGTGEFTVVPADAVIRSVGYRGIPIHGLPFDSQAHVVPNIHGKVIDLPNAYVAGWIKRGPSGIIGTNKKDAVATVETLMSNTHGGESRALTANHIDSILEERGVQFVDLEGWRRIDAAERELGTTTGRERTTIHDRETLLRIASDN